MDMFVNIKGVYCGIWPYVCDIDSPREDGFHSAWPCVEKHPLNFYVFAESFFKPAFAKHAKSVGDQRLCVRYVWKVSDAQYSFGADRKA